MQRPSTTPRRQRRAKPRRPGRPAGRTSDDGVIAGREALLAAAERLIRKRGPDVSLEAIAAEAGVTKPILYRGVGDRDALVNALALRLATRMAEQVARLVEGAEGPRDALERLVGGYLEHAADDRHLYLYVTAGGASEDRVQQSLQLADGAARQFAERIAAYRESRGADPSVANVWAYGLVGALHFVTLWWLRDEAIDRDEVTAHITELLWSGVGLEADAKIARRRK
jgi:AcrR family transcriptional regulator